MIVADIVQVALTTFFLADMVLGLIALVLYLGSEVRRFSKRNTPAKDSEEMSGEIAALATRNRELRHHLAQYEKPPAEEKE